jgi:hypothetical protein
VGLGRRERGNKKEREEKIIRRKIMGREKKRKKSIESERV